MADDRILQKDDVDMFCPDCNRVVPCFRTVYADVTYYTCKLKKHHFKHRLEDGKKIPGRRRTPPPMGYGEDD
jgi:hypothetical protein